jgi:hypothetical protein
MNPQIPRRSFTKQLNWSEVIYLVSGYALCNPENIAVMENTKLGKHRYDRYCLVMADAECNLADVFHWKAVGVFPLPDNWQLRENLREMRGLEFNSRDFMYKAKEIQPESVKEYKKLRGWL